MESIIILQSLHIFILIWAISAVLLLFRPRISLVWKVAALLLLLFYIWFFKEEIYKAIVLLKTDWFTSLVTFLKEFLFLLFYLLFIFWPLALVVVFYHSDDIGAERLLRFMVILTLVVWVCIISYVFLKKGIDQFIYQKLIKLVPFAG